MRDGHNSGQFSTACRTLTAVHDLPGLVRRSCQDPQPSPFPEGWPDQLGGPLFTQHTLEVSA
ncbi:hypothetical protein Dalu01_03251 [Deinococcus aluminii]|uniref:Uncharacterized protein n=1 Tax=Deinococcus aluminii TaxID=1656885 RepID=A0ABP9XHJ2_9DEIO